MTALAILDLGYGNTDSIRQAFARLGADAVITADETVIGQARRLVLPGVGAAGHAMYRLRQEGLVDVLRRRTAPTLGICLGMQLMFEASDEGDTQCLAMLPGRVHPLQPGPGCPVPHMGWSRIDRAEQETGLAAGDYVYFAHSYVCDDTASTAASATYGGQPIPSALRSGPLWGAQFHPERSSAAGARFLSAFLAS